MPAYFIVDTRIKDLTKRTEYDEYIAKVKPVAESFGGRYIIRSENITCLSDSWQPDHVIIIEFESKEQICTWLESDSYKAIAGMRIKSVNSSAIIVEE